MNYNKWKKLLCRKENIWLHATRKLFGSLQEQSVHTVQTLQYTLNHCECTSIFIIKIPFSILTPEGKQVLLIVCRGK